MRDPTSKIDNISFEFVANYNCTLPECTESQTQMNFLIKQLGLSILFATVVFAPNWMNKWSSQPPSQPANQPNKQTSKHIAIFPIVYIAALVFVYNKILFISHSLSSPCKQSTSLRTHTLTANATLAFHFIHIVNVCMHAYAYKFFLLFNWMVGWMVGW